MTCINIYTQIHDKNEISSLMWTFVWKCEIFDRITIRRNDGPKESPYNSHLYFGHFSRLVVVVASSYILFLFCFAVIFGVTVFFSLLSRTQSLSDIYGCCSDFSFDFLFIFLFSPFCFFFARVSFLFLTHFTGLTVCMCTKHTIHAFTYFFH